MDPAPPQLPDAVSDPGPTARERRVRTLSTAAVLSMLWLLGDALLGGPLRGAGLVHQIGALLLAFGGMVLFAGVLSAYRKAWHRSLRRGVNDLITRLWAATLRLIKSPGDGRRMTPLRPGERVALVAGLVLTALDVVLTTLLLRDVFPEPPYRFDLLGLLPEVAVEWSFYVAVAAFKTVLELWFGMVDRLRSDRGEAGGGWTALRFFVLGGASAFDAILAASRGLLLAEQGLDGAAVQVSNIVFIGFGIAVPWVAALTGSLLVSAADPLLAKLSPLRLLSGALRWATLAVLWCVAIGLGVPALAVLALAGLAAWTWRALEDAIGLALGQDVGPPPDTLVLVERAVAPSEAPHPDDEVFMRRAVGGVS